MARLCRVELFDPSEIAVIHTISSVVRNCYLMGDDPLTGTNFDHRKEWIETGLQRSAANFGIDVIAFCLMDTHMHLVLRTRPDVVASWDNTEVARRWLMLCPVRKNKDGSPKEPSEAELNTIRNNHKRLEEIRSRLSDISWLIRLLCQRVGQRANKEDGKRGNFWQSRYRSVRLLDEESILACAAYVDLNPIRAAMAETIESSPFTSAQKRITALKQQLADQTRLADLASSFPADTLPEVVRCDAFLSPVQIVESEPQQKPNSTNDGAVNDDAVCNGKVNDVSAVIGSQAVAGQLTTDIDATKASIDATGASAVGTSKGAAKLRCSDKGFTSLSTADYLQLLDWTARQAVAGKRGSTPEDAPPLFERLNISVEVWCELVVHFDEYFFLVAGKPQTVDAYRSRVKKHRFMMSRAARETMATC